MKIRLTTLLILALSLVHVQAASAAPLDECGELYHSGAYDRAAYCYGRLVSNDHLLSPALFYNIGNSFARDGKYGYAVLYYLRALYLDPKDADTAGNLALLRQELGLFSAEQTAAQHFSSLLSVSGWSLVGLAGVLIYLLYGLLRLRQHLMSLPEPLVIICCLLLVTCATAGAALRYRQWQQSVIIADSRLLTSPFSGAAPVGSLQQGRLVATEKHYDGYWYVTDETGKKGWLEAAVLEPILPLHQR